MGEFQHNRKVRCESQSCESIEDLAMVFERYANAGWHPGPIFQERGRYECIFTKEDECSHRFMPDHPGSQVCGVCRYVADTPHHDVRETLKPKPESVVLSAGEQ